MSTTFKREVPKDVGEQKDDDKIGVPRKNEASDGWSGEFFRLKGWQSKKQAQQGLAQELQSEITSQLKTLREQRTPPVQRAESLQTDKSLKAGKEFQEYIAALAMYEKLPQRKERPVRPKRPQFQPPENSEPTQGKIKGVSLSPITETNEYQVWMVADNDWQEKDGEWRKAADTRRKTTERLRVACQGYLDHFAKHGTSQQQQAPNIRKRDECQSTLAGLSEEAELDRKEAELTQMLTPPWDSATQMRALTMKAKKDFESLDIEGGENVEPSLNLAEQLGEPGANNSFWVNGKEGQNGGAKKTFIFKPMEEISPLKIVPPFGQAPREIMAGRVADVLNGMLGIDIGMPETQLITVDGKRFPKPPQTGKGFEPPPEGDVVGSLQQFAPTNGSLGSQPKGIRKAVSPECCQDMAVFDTITGNCDRHFGNFLVSGDEQNAKLVPIDHGLTFPEDPLWLSRMGPTQNSLLSLPGSHEKFSDKTIAKLKNLDPETLKQSLQGECSTVDTVHPGIKGKLSDRALDLAKQRAFFLKLACDALTPAAMQTALAENSPTLFPDPLLPDKEFEKAALKAITAAKATQGLLKKFFLMPPDEQTLLTSALRQDGWGDINESGSTFGGNKPMMLAAFAIGLKFPKLPDGSKQDIPPEMKAVFPAAPARLVPHWRKLTEMLGTDKREEMVAKLRALASKFYWPPDVQDKMFGSATDAKGVDQCLDLVMAHDALEKALTLDPEELTEKFNARMLKPKYGWITTSLSYVESSEKEALEKDATVCLEKTDHQGLTEVSARVFALLATEQRNRIDEYRGNVLKVQQALKGGEIEPTEAPTQKALQDLLVRLKEYDGLLKDGNLHSVGEQMKTVFVGEYAKVFG